MQPKMGPNHNPPFNPYPPCQAPQNRPLPFNATPAGYRQAPPPPYPAAYTPKPYPVQPMVQPKVKRPTAIGYFIWSICLIFILNPIGTLLGILSSVFACKANSADSAGEFIVKRKIAHRLCVAGTCIDAVTIVLMVSYVVAYINRFATSGLFGFYR